MILNHFNINVKVQCAFWSELKTHLTRVNKQRKNNYILHKKGRQIVSLFKETLSWIKAHFSLTNRCSLQGFSLALGICWHWILGVMLWKPNWSTLLPLKPAFNVYKFPTKKCNLKGTKREVIVTTPILFTL